MAIEINILSICIVEINNFSLLVTLKQGYLVVGMNVSLQNSIRLHYPELYPPSERFLRNENAEIRNIYIKLQVN